MTQDQTKFSWEQEYAMYCCSCALSVLVTQIAKGIPLDYDDPTVHFARERLWRLAASLPQQEKFFLQFERAVA